MRSRIWITVLVSVLALPAVARAHNVGHVFLPDGVCLEVGSVKEAPLVGQDRTQLDLGPATANPPRVEYGTSFVGFWGNTPILPGRCPVVATTTTSASPASAPRIPGSTNAATKPRAVAPSPGSVGPLVSLGPQKREGNPGSARASSRRVRRRPWAVGEDHRHGRFRCLCDDRNNEERSASCSIRRTGQLDERAVVAKGFEVRIDVDIEVDREAFRDRVAQQIDGALLFPE